MDEQNRKIYAAAKKYIGMAEVKGAEHNPKIVELFKRVGHGWVTDDETAWCAAFVGAVLEECGIASTRALNARSYLEWGTEVLRLEDVQQGDVVVLWRDRPDSWKGHVALYSKHDASNIYCLGGNQNDQVNITGYPLQRLLGIRRAPMWRQNLGTQTRGKSNG